MGREQWPLEVQGVETILDEGIKTEDRTTKELLIEVINELKKIEYHLSIASDADLTNTNL